MNSLRDVRPEDRDKILDWRNSPDVARYMYSDHLITAEEHERWFRSIGKDPCCRHWIIVCDQVDVGLVNIYGLDTQNQRCYWAFYIADPSTRGKGVGSFVEYAVLHYVFDELGLNKLCCEVLQFNTAVINMHKSFGFQQEGIYREHIVKGAEKFDVVALAMLRSEWEAKKQELEDRLRSKGIL